MDSAVHTNRLPLTALLMAAGLVAGFLLFWRTASPLSASSGVDLDFLFPPLAAWSCFMLLSRLAVWARHSRLAMLTWRRTRSGDGLRASTALLFGQKLLTDIAWFLLVLGLLSAIPTMAIAVADRTGGEGLASVVPYTHVFGSMALWGMLVMVPVAVLRAVADMRPERCSASCAAVVAPGRPRSRLRFAGERGRARRCVRLQGHDALCGPCRRTGVLLRRAGLAPHAHGADPTASAARPSSSALAR